MTIAPMENPIREARTGTALHEERLDAVMDYLLAAGVETVLDLGCGSGALLARLLAEPHLGRVVGVDRSAEALLTAERRLTAGKPTPDERLSLIHGCVTRVRDDLSGFDATVLVETIEHLDPQRLSVLERTVFARLRPRHVLITTPNRDYNTLYGLESDEYRHPDHRFEWGRRKFESWATGVGGRNAYDVVLEGIGPANAWFGSPSQMATFRRR